LLIHRLIPRVGPRIASRVIPEYLSGVKPGPSPFWQTKRGLVWSNPKAHDSVHIRAALLHPRFAQLLEIAVEFGLERVRKEWAILETERARSTVERILSHIEQGFARAATRN
jgi:hypothetical protein